MVVCQVVWNLCPRDVSSEKPESRKFFVVEDHLHGLKEDENILLQGIFADSFYTLQMVCFWSQLIHCLYYDSDVRLETESMATCMSSSKTKLASFKIERIRLFDERKDKADTTRIKRVRNNQNLKGNSDFE